jgi:cell division protein FtsB
VKALPWLGLVLALSLARAALDEETGVRPWLYLRAELADAHARIASLETEIAGLRREAQQLEAGDYALERAIREELELVRPGQTLVRLRRRGVPSARIP